MSTELIIITIYLAVLVCLSVIDVKTRRVPLCVNAGALFLIIFYRVLSDTMSWEYVFSAMVIFLILVIGVSFFNLGGGDAITGGLFGLYLGIYGLVAVFLSLVFTLPYLIVQLKRGNKKPDYAFIPYMAVGYVVTIIIMYLFYA